MPETITYKVPDLDDPELFWRRVGVPILDDHVRPYPPRPDGSFRQPDVFDEARLERIAARSNARVAEGDLAILRIGHIQHKPGVPEDEQPEPIGFARNFRTAILVDDDGRNIKPGLHIVADFYYYTSVPKSRVESFPHRSIEINVADDFIDGVSLLRRPPERPLGILTYARRDASDESPGVWVGFWLSPPLADQLAIPNGESAKELHCTLVYLGRDLSPEAIEAARSACREYAAGSPDASIEGLIGGVGRFAASESSDGQDVVHALLDVPKLAEFRRGLASALTDAGLTIASKHAFNPHVTLKYVDMREETPIHRLPPSPVRFDELVFAVGDDRERFKLKSDAGEPSGGEPEHTETPVPEIPMTPEETASLVNAIVSAVVAAMKGGDASRETMSESDEEEDRVNNESSAPSGSNTFVPAGSEKKDERENMSRRTDFSAGLVDRLDKLERENREKDATIATLKSDLERVRDDADEIRINYAREQVDSRLSELEKEGVQFDRQTESDHLLSLDETARQAHLNRIRSNYAKFPVGQSFITETVPINARKNKELTADERNRLRNYCTRTGESLTSAKEKFIAGQLSI